MPVSSTVQSEMFAETSGDGYLVALTLDHESFALPIRVVDNTENITRSGDLFVAYPFIIDLPSTDGSKKPAARLKIDAVDRVIIASIRGANGPISVQIDIIRVEDPTGPPEITYTGFRLQDVTYDAFEIEGYFVLRDLDQEPYPFRRFVPAYFPALFASVS